MNRCFTLILISLVAFVAKAADIPQTVHAKKALEIYRQIIAIPTVEGRGKVPEMAAYLASEFRMAGFPEEDIRILPKGETAALVVYFRGDGSAGKKPILLLGHMDVVEALDKDWQRPPFELTEDDEYFYGRGSIDNKLGIAMLSSTFIRLKNEGFVPSRDLIIAFSGDEETGMLTTRMLVEPGLGLINAEFALNSDAGGGDLSEDGKAVAYLVQAAEKTYTSFKLTATNPGGHSSRPRPDNAIYDLAAALGNIQQFQFPVMSSDMTRHFFRTTGGQLGGELGEAMIQFADDPQNKTASDRLALESSYVGSTRTTCVPTMIEGGHAENALPQSASVVINCRIFPGVKVEEVQNTLQQVVANPGLEFSVMGSPTESPISELREDVMNAVTTAVHQRYPDVAVMGYMESGGTDGMHFRAKGVPTWGVASVFMNPDEMFAHGLNERLPIKAFYDGLDHWSIILKELAGHQ
ncbi:M20/M25/M40 family metallo-hydrolase [Neptunicella sp. SCSIO 80796]|uniref:M20/M25/M40 family metallo-hydrolase n=1 Tax=Neptunicella plasticusilytica TaxID=3117012 RepID=UPI003A4D6194